MKPLIIAELSANHQQNLELAKAHIKAAKEIGADGVKIQSYTPECLTLNSNKEHFKIRDGLWEGQYLYELYSHAYTPLEWHQELFDYAKKIGILLFSSPFSFKTLELLEKLNCPMYKVASFELTDLQLITKIASTGKPLILSSGIATDEEISEVIALCRSLGNNSLTLLKCSSAYPASFNEANLLAMPNFAKKWGVKFGLSDHSPGSLLPVIATSLGASMIEKHFILDRSLGGADASFSLNKEEFRTMIQEINLTHQALGNPNHQNRIDSPNRKFARSLFVQKAIKRGEHFTLDHLSIKRPNIGLHPRFLEKIIGRKATKDLDFGDPLTREDFD